jgi:hypothetical protein
VLCVGNVATPQGMSVSVSETPEGVLLLWLNRQVSRPNSGEGVGETDALDDLDSKKSHLHVACTCTCTVALQHLLHTYCS